MEKIFSMEDEALDCHEKLLLLKERWIRKFGSIS